MDNEVLCIFCQTNAADKKDIVWLCEGPRPEVFKCTRCLESWYEWVEPSGFTIILGTKDYQTLYRKLRPDTPLEIISNILLNPTFLNFIRYWHYGDTQLFQTLERWIKFNQARRVGTQI